jgi:hypothetical protein
VKLVGIVIALFVLAVSAVAEPTLTLDAGYRDMYKLQFQAAHQVFEHWQSANPKDPLGPVSDAAAYLFAEFDRMHVLESELFQLFMPLRKRAAVCWEKPRRAVAPSFNRSSDR